VQVNLDDDVDVPGQGEQIKQALLNLVLNALQAMPDGGTLRVSTRIIANEIHIEVSDNGPGVAPEDRDRIFNPFVTTRETGTGLGLAITQRIVQGHDGHIMLKDTSARGAIFVLCLPLSSGGMEPSTLYECQ
jgi:signal transduction histidine kinase